MQNRSSNNASKDNTNIRSYIYQGLIGGTASYAGLYNGILLHASDIGGFATPSILSATPYALGTALAIGGSLYVINRFGSICIGNGEDMNSKSKARSSAAIAATAFGTSTLAAWSLSNHEHMFWRHIGDRLLRAGFSESMASRLFGTTVAGAGLIACLGSVIVINKAQNQYNKLEGSNLKEKAKFLLFHDRSNRDKVKSLKNEVIKDTDSSVLRKI